MGSNDHFSFRNFWKAIGIPNTFLSHSDGVHKTRWAALREICMWALLLLLFLILFLFTIPLWQHPTFLSLHCPDSGETSVKWHINLITSGFLFTLYRSQNILLFSFIRKIFNSQKLPWGLKSSIFQIISNKKKAIYCYFS